MNLADNIILKAESKCHARGTKLTVKRKQVLALLIEQHKALSAYGLVEAYKLRYQQSIPAMSVYRILNFLEQENLVHRLKLANKFVACTHISCDHEHHQAQFLICETCGNVAEVHLNKQTTQDITSSIENAGFRLAADQIEINCICQSCDLH